MAINGGKINFQIGYTVDKKGLQEIQNSFDKISASSKMSNFSKNFTQETTLAGKAASDLSSKLSGAFDFSTGTLSIGKFQSLLQSTGKTLTGYQQAFLQSGSAGVAAFSNLNRILLTSQTTITKTEGLMDKMITQFSKTAIWSLANRAFNSIIGSVQKAVSYVEDLDKSLTNIQIVTKASSEEMDKFAQKANQAAKELAVSTTDYTNAALIYYQQGLKGSDVTKRADITSKVSNVTGQDTNTVSEELTAVWNGYKVSTEQAEAAVDQIAAVAANSASSLAELSEGMSKVASAANEMGITEEQLVAQLSTIISTTRQDASSVGTALKTVYARLGDLKVDGQDEDGVKLGEVSSTLQKLGINILNETGNLRDMGTVIEEVEEKWQGWTEAQKQAAAIAMAGKRQYNNLIALFSNWDKYAENLEVAKNSTGELQAQQEQYLDSIEAKQAQLKASKETIYMDLIDPGDVKGIYDILNGIVSVTEHLINPLEKGHNMLLTWGIILTSIAGIMNNKIGSGISNVILGNTKVAEQARVIKSIQDQITASQQKYNEEKVREATIHQNISDVARRNAQGIAEMSGASIAGQNKAAMMKASTSMSEGEQQQVNNLNSQIAQARVDSTRDLLQLTQELTALEGKGVELSETHKDILTEEVQKAMEGKNVDTERLQIVIDAMQAAVNKQAVTEQEITNSQQAVEKEEAKLSIMNDEVAAVEKELAEQEELLKMLGTQNDYIKSRTAEGVSASAAKADYESQKQAVDAAKQAVQTKQAERDAQAAVVEKKKQELDLAQNSNEIQERNNAALGNSKALLSNITTQQSTINSLQSTFNDLINRAIHTGGLKNVMSGTIQAFSSGVMAVNSFRSALKALSDENLSTEEKITQIAMSAMMLGPMFSSSIAGISKLREGILAFTASQDVLNISNATGLSISEAKTVATELETLATAGTVGQKEIEQALVEKGLSQKTAETVATYAVTTAKEKEIIASGANTIAKGNESRAEEVNTAATEKNTIAKIANWAATHPIATAAIVAGVALVAFTAIILSQTNALEKATEAAKESAKGTQELSKAAQEAGKKYNELITSIEKYHDAKKALNELTLGTQEWKDKVTELNEQVLSLLDNYPQLAKYLTSNNGVLELNEEGIQALEEEQIDNRNKLTNSALSGKITDIEKNNAVTLAKLNNSDGTTGYEFLDYEIYDQYSNESTKYYSYAGLDDLLGSDENITDFAKQVLNNSSLLDDGNEEELKTFLKNNYNLEIDDKFIPALKSAREDLIKFGLGLQQSTETAKIYQDQIAQNILSEKGIYEGDTEYSQKQYKKYTDVVGAIYRTEYEDLLKNGYENLSDDDKRSIAESYGVGKGISYDDVEIDGDKIVFKKDGEEIEKTTWDAVKKFDASTKASEEASKNYQKIVNQLESTAKSIGISSETLAKNYGAKEVDLSNEFSTKIVGKNRENIVQNAIDNWEALGYANEEAAEKAYQKGIDKLNEQFDNLTTGTFGEELLNITLRINKELNNLSLEQKSTIKQNLIDAYKEGGPAAMTAIEDLYKGVSEQQAIELNEALKNIDFSNFDSLEESYDTVKNIVGDTVENFDWIWNRLSRIAESSKLIQKDWSTTVADAQTALEAINGLDLDNGKAINKNTAEALANVIDIDKYLKKIGNYYYLKDGITKADLTEAIQEETSPEALLNRMSNFYNIRNSYSNFSDDKKAEYEKSIKVDDKMLSKEYDATNPGEAANAKTLLDTYAGAGTYEAFQKQYLEAETEEDKALILQSMNGMLEEAFKYVTMKVSDIANDYMGMYATEGDGTGVTNAYNQLMASASANERESITDDYISNLQLAIQQYPLLEAETADYIQQLKKAEIGSTDFLDAQEKINNSIRAAQWRKASREVKSYAQAISDATDENGNWNGTMNEEDREKNVKGEINALNSALGTNFDTSFLLNKDGTLNKAHQDLIDNWLDGDEDAAEELKWEALANSEEVKQYWELHAEDLKDQYSDVKDMLKDIKFTAEGKADFTDINNKLGGSMKKTEAFARMLSSIVGAKINLIYKVNGIGYTDRNSALAAAGGDPNKIQAEITGADVSADWSKFNEVDKDDGSHKDGDDGSKKTYEKDDASYVDSSKKYHQLDRTLKRLKKTIDALNDANSKLWGTSLINNLTKTNRELTKYNNKLSKVISKDSEYLKTLQSKAKTDSNLKNLGIKFSGSGEIKNYQTVYDKLQSEYEKAVENYNKKLDEASETTKKNAKTALDAFTDWAEAYEDTLDDITAKEDEIIENLNTIYENNKTLMDKASEYSESAMTRKTSNAEIKSSMHVDGSDDATRASYIENKTTMRLPLADIKNQQTTMKIAEEELKKMKAGKWSRIYGRDMTAAVEDIDNASSKIKEDISAIYEGLNTAISDFNSSLDTFDSKMSEQISALDTLNTKLQHSLKLQGILYGEDSSTYYANALEAERSSYDINSAKRDAQFKEYQQWKVKYEIELNNSKNKKLTQVERETAEVMANTYKEHMDSAWSESESAAADTLENITKIFEYSAKKIGASFEESLTVGGKGGFDFVKTQWDLISKIEKQYLDDANRNNGIVQLQYKYYEAINDAANKSANAQQKINDLMSEQLSMLEAKDKLSQYDLDRAEAQLNILLKQIALEEAQENKSKLKLKRDAQGNYSYVYGSDREAQEKAKAELSKAETEAYNKDKENAQKVVNDTIGMLSSFKGEIDKVNPQDQEAINDIINKYSTLFEGQDGLWEDAIGYLKESGLKEYNKLNGTNVDENDEAFLEWLKIQNPLLFDSDGVNIIENLRTALENGDFDAIKSALGDSFEEYFEKAQSASMSPFEQDISTSVDSIDSTLSSIKEVLDNMFKEGGTFDTYVTKAVDYVDLAVEYIKTNNPDIQGGANAATSANTYLAGEEGKATTAANNSAQAEADKSTNKKIEVSDNVTVQAKNGVKARTTKTGKKEKLLKKGSSYRVGSIDKKAKYGVQLISKKDKSYYVPYSWFSNTKKFTGFDTGGYTGAWNGASGKLAMLHQKEIVLNKQDTKNFLEAIEILRDLTSKSYKSIIGGYENIIQSFGNNLGRISTESNEKANIDQNVVINADFSGVSSADEIEAAFNSLVNKSAQYAWSNKLDV